MSYRLEFLGLPWSPPWRGAGLVSWVQDHATYQGALRCAVRVIVRHRIDITRHQPVIVHPSSGARMPVSSAEIHALVARGGVL